MSIYANSKGKLCQIKEKPFKLEKKKLNRIYCNYFPDEVIEYFEQQEHYYTSVDTEFENSFTTTKGSTPTYNTSTILK